MFLSVSIWLILALILFCIELLTTSFYLLTLSLACLAGALSAYLGWSESSQIALSALLAVLLLLGLRRFKHQFKIGSSTPDLNLDIGAKIEVKTVDVNGVAIVDYRGAWWQARLDESTTSPPPIQPGLFIIVGMDGNTLILSPVSK